jgi:hypothetical protein
MQIVLTRINVINRPTHVTLAWIPTIVPSSTNNILSVILEGVNALDVSLIPIVTLGRFVPQTKNAFPVAGMTHIV